MPAQITRPVGASYVIASHTDYCGGRNRLARSNVRAVTRGSVRTSACSPGGTGRSGRKTRSALAPEARVVGLLPSHLRALAGGTRPLAGSGQVRPPSWHGTGRRTADRRPRIRGNTGRRAWRILPHKPHRSARIADRAGSTRRSREPEA